MADYDVVLLIEQSLTQADAARIRSLHEGLEDPVTYRVLMPQEDAAERVEAALGGLSAGELGAIPTMGASHLGGEDLDAVRKESRDRSHAQLAESLAALAAVGASATGVVVTDAPVAALAAAIKEVDGREAIIVTRPHLVAEFFHVDWSAQARRHLEVPVLHLVEHQTFDEQAGEGEGVTGL